MVNGDDGGESLHRRLSSTARAQFHPPTRNPHHHHRRLARLLRRQSPTLLALPAEDHVLPPLRPAGRRQLRLPLRLLSEASRRSVPQLRIRVRLQRRLGYRSHIRAAGGHDRLQLVFSPSTSPFFGDAAALLSYFFDHERIQSFGRRYDQLRFDYQPR